MKLQLLHYLKNHGTLPPINFNPNPSIENKPKKTGLPKGKDKYSTGRIQHQDHIDIFTDLQDRFIWGTIEVPRYPYENNQGEEPQDGHPKLHYYQEPPNGRGPSYTQTEIAQIGKQNYV